MQARNRGSKAAHRHTKAIFRRRWLLAPLAAAVAAATLAAPAAAPAAVNYRVIQLSASPGGGLAINAKGQVGFTVIAGGAVRGRFYDGQAVRDIGTLGGSFTVVEALNDHGQLTGGAAFGEAGPLHAFRWSKATGMQDLHGMNESGSNSYAVSINDKGWVAGYAWARGDLPFQAVRWTPATGMAYLGAFSHNAFASVINDAGAIAGYADTPEPGIRGKAFRWTQAGGVQSLANASSVFSKANDINEAGEVVGSNTDDLSIQDRATLWTAQGTQVDLGSRIGFLSDADRINDKGLVIGKTWDSFAASRGIVWSREHGIVEFGTAGVETSFAGDLNNLGQVVGRIGDQAIAWTRAGGVVNLNTRIPGAPPELSLYEALAVSDNGSIVVTGNTGLVLLVPSLAYNQPPVAAPIRLTGATRVNSLLSFSAAFRDVDLRETHTASWSWGDGGSTVGIVGEAAGTGSVSGQHAYARTGIYTVRLDLLDSGGKRTAVERKITVCGCRAAVAGEGSFVSPAGARSGTGAAAAMAARRSTGSFAFVADAGTAQPGAGQAAVEVDVAALVLRSTAIDALAVNGNRMQLSGSGSVNGKDGYRFMLSTVSGSKTGGEDRVRVRISHREPGSKAEVIDYDNGADYASKAGPAGAAHGLHAEGSVVVGGNLSHGAQ